MRSRSRYTITIENESRLEKIFQVSLSPLVLLLAIFSTALAFIGIGAILLFVSPAHNLLPGYLKESERAATEEQHMRMDSILQAYSANETYINNLKNIIVDNLSNVDYGVLMSDSVGIPATALDSMMSSSKEELQFATMMREKEKYNISVIAPLAAESMMFSPINEESIVSTDSRKSYSAKIILPLASSVAAIADGTVISVSQSLREGGGAAVILQHSKGFLTRYSRLGTVLVESGDRISGGQVIALSAKRNGRKNEIIFIEMWHNGTPLIPFEYLEDAYVVKDTVVLSDNRHPY